MLEVLGTFIRLKRLQKNLTLERLSKLAGVSRRQLALVEDGHNVSILFLSKICNVLEIEVVPLTDTLRLVSPLRSSPPSSRPKRHWNA